MMTRRTLSALAAAGAASAILTGSALAQSTIKIGEMNSYKAQPAFLDPYKKGWELAVEEINAAGGVLGKKLEVVSRDDGGNPGDAVRVAEELVTRENVALLTGTFLSHVGLAVTEFAGRKKVFFLASEPLTDKITWQNGNRYTFRLRPSTYMQTAMLIPAAVAAKKKKWAMIYPNYEYGQSAAATFKELLKKAQPDVEFVTEQAPPLGKVDAGAVLQAVDDAKPDAIFNVLFGADLAKLAREGATRGVFKDRFVVSLLSGEPEYLDPLKEDTPAGWVVTGYPWDEIKTPQHQKFVDAYRKRWNDYPRLGSMVGYDSIKAIAAGIAKAGSTDPEALIKAFRGLKVDGAFASYDYRASDQQATVGAYVGTLALKDGKGTMKDFQYVAGDKVLPSDEEVKKLRPAAAME
ncbi:leucine-, isoleucine-, valine-, threonine-, and alanine-binding protein precursor [Variibacter gotjawalensis]|uniref:Leucine-, isoleucine-, valine-, threonine-, and alanine-binding protein n=2 Tax=Variibacter gotjawalensis TaxID=1333996 RepID=A0A0S3PPT5_9BRAD|nr:amino acid/amide ABC transporter substrate-binding protein (HAAT family) [Variibacter gotjawalensis]BAT57940.1 leucine-, isoleucine-, valine-, threonine-, and alanine-binding protein precursor [Variibacter gotjawalensis]